MRMVTQEERELRERCNCIRNGLGLTQQLRNWIRFSANNHYEGTELGKFLWQQSIALINIKERLQIKLEKLEEDIEEIEVRKQVEQKYLI